MHKGKIMSHKESKELANTSTNDLFSTPGAFVSPVRLLSGNEYRVLTFACHSCGAPTYDSKSSGLALEELGLVIKAKEGLIWTATELGRTVYQLGDDACA